MAILLNVLREHIARRVQAPRKQRLPDNSQAVLNGLGKPGTLQAVHKQAVRITIPVRRGRIVRRAQRKY
jgi:hypothetical protein